MGKLKMSKKLGFASLMYVNFIIKKKENVQETAKKMGVSMDTLYRYIRGENIIPPDRIVDLIQSTKNIEYLEFFCDPNGYIPIPKIKSKHALETFSQFAKLMNLVTNPKEDDDGAIS